MVSLEEFEKEDYESLQKSNPSKKIKKDDNVIETSFTETSDYLLEQIKDASLASLASYNTGVPTMYILYDKNNKSTQTISEFVNGKYTYKPILSKMIDKRSIYLPTGVEKYIDLEEIIDDIRKYYSHYFEAPGFFQDFLPYYTVFTWVYDKFPFIPYLHFVGRTGTGKSWTAETVASLCYKAIDAAGSVTIASLFRSADKWGGTIYLDEFDLKNFGSEGKTAMENFMKAGVSDRSILRVEGNNNKNMQVIPYTVKAPKLFTSESPISSAGLQSRTILIQMEKNKKRLPLYKLNDYHERGEKIRNKLLLWRLNTLNNVNLKDIEYGFKELELFDRRVQQVLTPIYYIANKKAKKKILKFAKTQEEETKRQRRESEEGQVSQFIYDYWSLNKVNPDLKGITEQINKQRDDDGYKTKRSERKMGEIIRKVLGFDTERRGHENITRILVEENQEKLEELVDYYGFGLPVQHNASVASTAEGDYLKMAENEQIPFDKD